MTREQHTTRADLVRWLVAARRASRDEHRTAEERERAHELVGILLARLTVLDAALPHENDGGR